MLLFPQFFTYQNVCTAYMFWIKQVSLTLDASYLEYIVFYKGFGFGIYVTPKSIPCL